MHRYNLFIVADPQRQDPRDFTGIARLVQEIDPSIRAEFLSVHRRARSPRWISLLRPTLTVVFHKERRFRPLRGFQALVDGPDKVMEYGRMEAAGLPVPKWCEVTPDSRFDPADWGDYVVEKPSLGGRGAYVRLRRTDRVRYRPRDSLPEDHPGRAGPMVIQRFVYTGETPVAYRVLTCFGRVVMAIRYHNETANLRDNELPGYGRVSTNIVAAARGCTISMANETDVQALGAACHGVFPEIPIVGSDLIRDAATGKLWIAEVNRGYCWMVSSGGGLKMQEAFGLDFYGQFDALRRAAEGMVDATRRLAR